MVAFGGSGMDGIVIPTILLRAAKCVGPSTSRWTTDVVLWVASEGGRKRRGNAMSIWCAQRRAALSQEKILLRPY